jgi:hypothetical protein
MKALILLLAVALLAGCATTLADFKKPDNLQYFVLDKDHLRTEVRGLVKTKWTEGLRAGTYTLVAEDAEGLFFQGSQDCVIVLSGKLAERYEQAGTIASLDERNSHQAVPSTGLGGVWLPKPGIRKPPRLFYDQHNRTNGAAAGLIGMAIVSLTEGNLVFIPYASETDFFAKLPMVLGSPPDTTASGS